MDPDKIGKLHKHDWFTALPGRTLTGTLDCRECGVAIYPEDRKFWDKLYKLFEKCEEWRAEESEKEMLRLRDSLTDRIGGILRLTGFCQLRDYQALQVLQPAYYPLDDYALWIMVREGGLHDGLAVLRVGIELRHFRPSMWEFTHVFGDDLGEERFEPQAEPSIHNMKYDLPFDRVVRRREQDRGAGVRYANEHP